MTVGIWVKPKNVSDHGNSRAKIPRAGVNKLWPVGRIWPWPACVYSTLENGFQIINGLEKTKDM